MGKHYTEIQPEHCEFIAQQKIFFVGTATADSRVNVSPKGMDSLRVLGPTRVLWLNVTGSGNETAAHVQINPRITLMFCAFDGAPIILRLYGQARVYHVYDPEWSALAAQLPAQPGARQIFDVAVDLVQRSCGMGVPYFNFAGEREQLNDWAQRRGEAGIAEYWAKRNQRTIDGLPTAVLGKPDAAN